MKLRPVRGTHDLFGEEIKKFNIIKDIVSKIAKLNSFNEFQSPIFEFTNLFLKPLGEHSDVVLKEMYTFKDRNEEQLTLRPEYTTPMIRGAITNNLLNDLPLKLYGLGPMFRRERPQKGRYRQFNQINFEIFGTDDYLADFELIFIANEILKSLLPNNNFELHLNSLGSKLNLIKYKSVLSKYFQDKNQFLTKESKEKIYSNPLRILDSKYNEDQKVCDLAPRINEYLDQDLKNHFERLKKALKLSNIEYKENHKLVRGLDYYCSTVFEFKTNDIGSQNTLLGGGRYDGLIGTLGGPNIPGIGWAAGVERVSMLMDQSINTNNSLVHIALMDDKFKDHLINLINFLHKNSIEYFWNFKYNLKKSLSKASDDKIKYIIIIGEDEFKNNSYTVKNLLNGNQSQIKLDEIKNYLNDKS